MNGFYAMYFTGRRGSSHAVLLMKDGVIAGADAAGGVIDGTYSDKGSGNVDISVTLKIPAGTPLVTGAIVEEETSVQKITAELPANLGNGRPVGIRTPTGPVNVIFRRLRNIS